MPKGQITWITYQGETRSLTAWARTLGIPQKTLWNRLRAGWSLADAMTTAAAVPGPPPSRAPRPTTGLAPHIDGPAIAVQGQWVPVALWLCSQEET